MGDNEQDLRVYGHALAEVEGHGYTRPLQDAPAGDGDGETPVIEGRYGPARDADAETPEVEGRLFRAGGEAADAEALLMARDKEK
ncbi:MAG: hypothetical protein AVDCRST_MAG73-812 [uncultured Thermomicrobiales bacterium]|uniref:Uncharacterized protein n=1 Tax=uncultured Thermomicrobiales bacterium TaxID=1645740 RepID=A0A6J4TQ32_9BACT|nr:MAG: hypothetical protein AVDCRST_MAG73-812 [uncultured Thermomicrobiales bacterium]